MELPRLHGIIPPLATPLKPDGSLDEAALAKLVEFLLEAGVQGLWVLGTTARFDLLTDERQRRVAEIVAATNAGRVPLVLNVSDLSQTAFDVRLEYENGRSETVRLERPARERNDGRFFLEFGGPLRAATLSLPAGAEGTVEARVCP